MPRMSQRRMNRSSPLRPAERWLVQAVKRIASRVKPKKIILFGSYAYGKPHIHSDIDLLVVLDRPSNRDRRYELVDKALGEHVWPVDLLVRRPNEIESRLRIGDSFMRDIMENGKVLYES